MNDLVEALRAQAASSRPRPDLEDALRRARARHQRAVGFRVLAVTIVVVLVVGTGIVLAQGGGGGGRTVVAGEPHGLPALIIGPPPGRGLDRRDPGAGQGPWTAVVRRAGGVLGSGGAVVTFPVAGLPSGRDVVVSGRPGRAGDRQVVWPIAGAYARVRGDLPEAELLAIAQRTSISAGRPVVRAPTGASVVFAGPYRAPDVHEARYGSAALGEGASLGNGLAYTGVLSAGGFEDQLYARHARGGYRVDGHPAVLSSVQGGNATLAWELSPGVVVYVGYSGSSVSDAAARALTRLAERARLIGPAAWQAANNQVVVQTNDFR